MQYVKGLEHYVNAEKSAVSFGKFDGLHRGHKKLIKKVKELSERENISSVVCSFDMQAPEILMTETERKEFLEHEADYLVDCAFTKELREIEAEDFIRDIIAGVFHAEYVVVGTDFQFGYGKRGDIHMLKAYEKQYGYELVVIEKERYGERIISSTYIKEVLKEGRPHLVGELLGYPYRVSGIVEHGRKLGRTLGFPTLNVIWPERKTIPARGVYLCRVLVEGSFYNGIANIGIRPTVSEGDQILIESFLFEYGGDAYGKEVRIELLEYLRPEQKFSGKTELKKYVDKDIRKGKEYFGIGEYR